MSVELDLGFLRRNRIRHIRQAEITECGLASLAMVADFHNTGIGLATLRRRFGPSLRGASIKSLISVAGEIGFTSRAVKLPLEELSNLHVPAILHWNLNHFVVLERVRRNKAHIFDPATTQRWMSMGEVSNHFTGVALELYPAANLGKSAPEERLSLSQLWGRLTGLKRSLAQVLVLSLIMQAFVLAFPYYMQISIDQALPAYDAGLLSVLAIGFGLFTVLNVFASSLRALVLLSAGTSLSFGVSSNLARRLFRLPVTWFEKRHVGDVLSRFQSVGPIQQALTQGAVAALLDGMLAMLVLFMMCFYNVFLAAFTAAAFAIYGLIRAISYSFEQRAQAETITTGAKEQSMLIETIRGMTTLRLFNRESSRHAQWLTRLTDAVNASVHLSRTRIWQQMAGEAILGLEAVVAVWLTVSLVMSGGFSVGMIFAYMAYRSQFLQRATSLVDQLVAFRMLRLHLERLSDIGLAEEDRSFLTNPNASQVLHGRLELRGICFRYSRSDPLVLKDLDLVVEPGQHIAVTGVSGGGKSTLVRIVLGLLQPDAGEVLIDGVPLEKFGYRNYRDQVGAVLQDDHLFSGSLTSNIALFDDTPDPHRVVEVAEAAGVHTEIMSMPMGYETLVGDMGSSLSGGQKQRILIARALYRRPKLLVMDESTSHLDPATEARVNSTIADLGITRIVIAHRKETVAAAEVSYNLQGGILHGAGQGASDNEP